MERYKQQQQIQLDSNKKRRMPFASKDHTTKLI